MKQIYKNRKLLFGQFGNKAVITMVMIIISALLEGFSFGMIMPLLEVIIEGDTGDNPFSEFSAGIMSGVENEGDRALYIAILIFGLFVLKNVFVTLKNAFMYGFEWSVRGAWMKRLFPLYLTMPFGQFGELKEGEVVNFVTNETLKAASAIRQLLELCSQILIVLVLLTILLASNTQITLGLIALTFCILFASRKVVSSYAESVGQKRLHYDSAVSQILVESLSGMQTVRALELSDTMSDRFKNKVNPLVAVVSRSELIKRLPMQISEVTFALLFVLIIFSVDRFSEEDLSSFLPFLGMLVVVATRLFSNIGSLSTNVMAIKILLPSVRMIEKLLDEAAGIKAGINKNTRERKFTGLEEGLEILGLSFSYDSKINTLVEGQKGSKKYTIDRLELSISKNEMVGIVGTSGVGKSTFVKLLLALYEPDAGEILVDGVSLQDLDLGSWRRHIGYVNQEPFFFNGTIKENFAMLKPDVSDKEIEHVLELAQCTDFVGNMANGINSTLGDKGLTISGGQRTRLALARALILEPSILILDEVTSSLDSSTGENVIRTIESLKGQTTIIVVTHNHDLIRSADKVYTFRHNTEDEYVQMSIA